jgi:hypothetical protein
MTDWPKEYPNNVRVDRGPPVRQAKATKELFASGQLAGHYARGRMDALGAEIVEGQKFTYIDWKAPPEDHVFSVYQLRDVDGDCIECEFDDDGKRIARYVLVERFATEGEADKAARKLAGGIELWFS